MELACSPAQPEKEQHGRDGLDRQLGQGEIGRGQPDEADARHQTRAAHENEGREAVEFALIGRGQRAGASYGPDQRECDIERRSRRPPYIDSVNEHRSEAGEQGRAEHQPQLWLQAARAQQFLQPSCELP